MPHDPSHEYDDNCHGCQPALVDVKTGKPYPPNHPIMVAILRVWREETTLEERRAYHRVVFQLSRNPKELAITNRIMELMKQTLSEVKD